jgi:hypothetical protein
VAGLLFSTSRWNGVGMPSMILTSLNAPARYASVHCSIFRCIHRSFSTHRCTSNICGVPWALLDYIAGLAVDIFHLQDPELVVVQVGRTAEIVVRKIGAEELVVLGRGRDEPDPLVFGEIGPEVASAKVRAWIRKPTLQVRGELNTTSTL